MKTFLAIALLSLLPACTLPQTSVRSGSAQPTLLVKGAPTGAMLYVDGLSMGLAEQYNAAPNVLVVLQGVHQVEIRQGSNILYTEKVLASTGESHTIAMPRGAAK